MVNIVVGQDEHKTTFKVHEDALCDRSEFFRRAMKPEWSSMRDDPRTIELPEDDPDAFSMYQTWLYSGKLAIMSSAPPTTPPEPPTSAIARLAGRTTDSQLSNHAAPQTPQNNSTTLDSLDPASHYHTLAHAYVLGERLLDKPFKNAIADVYVLYARGIPPSERYYPSNEEIRVLYDGTGEGSPIRQLLVDIWYCRGKYDWVAREDAVDLPAEFLASVVRELFKVRGEGRGFEHLSRPWKLNHVQYHDA